jgi:hypothetical protein
VRLLQTQLTKPFDALFIKWCVACFFAQDGDAVTRVVRSTRHVLHSFHGVLLLSCVEHSTNRQEREINYSRSWSTILPYIYDFFFRLTGKLMHAEIGAMLNPMTSSALLRFDSLIAKAKSEGL